MALHWVVAVTFHAAGVTLAAPIAVASFLVALTPALLSLMLYRHSRNWRDARVGSRSREKDYATTLRRVSLVSLTAARVPNATPSAITTCAARWPTVLAHVLHKHGRNRNDALVEFNQEVRHAGAFGGILVGGCVPLAASVARTTEHRAIAAHLASSQTRYARILEP
jgi:hypothetical protein